MSMELTDRIDLEENRTTLKTAHHVAESVDLEVLGSFDDSSFEGEPSLTVELIDLYQEEVPRLFQGIEEGLGSHDWKTISRLAHSLKGCSANLGILQMALIAADLEHLPTNDAQAASQLLISLEEEFQRVTPILIQERSRRVTS